VERGRITAGEITMACSHYDLGAVEEVRRLRGGSRLSPKVLLISRVPNGQGGTNRAAFLLKRRAPEQSDPYRVALSHQVILHLATRGFPVAPLLGTRSENNSMLQLHGSVYEVFRFVPGMTYDRREHASMDAGRTLARCHRMLAELHPTWEPPRGTFHAVSGAVERLGVIPQALGRTADASVAALIRDLAVLYRHAAGEAERLGGGQGTSQLIHGDWHPGNMVFRPVSKGSSERVVAAVIDFDSVRMGLPLHDVANGALQFSMLRGAKHEGSRGDNASAGDPMAPAGISNPDDWPENLGISCFRAFLRGYHAEAQHGAGGPGVSSAGSTEGTPRGAEALPWLMIEALIVEVAAPIAATGRFGKVDPVAVLRAAARTASWIRAHARELSASVA
jgi:aminoglycoside phosphotransferase (APT) family kinase protein